MDGEHVESLLDYVFTDEDFDETPTMKEFKRLKRVMNVMVGFYVRGSESKKKQLSTSTEELQKIHQCEEMINSQLESLKNFPAYHPKRIYYEEELNYELKAMSAQKEKIEKEFVNFESLYQWSLGIVDTMQFLEKNLQSYANDILDADFDTEPIKVTVDEYLKYKKGLEEITFNLQESQDFFDASLDGRLEEYHKIEKEMIVEQLKVVGEYSEDNPRRQHVLDELHKDLQFVMNNMVVDDRVTRRRERMRKLHQDFFAVLKWQREKIIKMLEDEPEKIEGDVDSLKEQLVDVLDEIKQLRERPPESKKVVAFRTMSDDGSVVIKNLVGDIEQ
eukprot:TRINITY_DN3513_c0_g1_i1.p1 TRINITY_DN3513_c0_g1~~TRINITY_DN3513_c0_g1_i1.p1  ORF type:complete len:332 (+),score=118.70 TRINITY_DN3513_c0_g1_i1:31-1026(+)